MTEEILVNVTPRETRVAVVENGMLQELHLERGWSRGVVGNIYKGKVQRVMPGMQAAFVEIGLDRAALSRIAAFASAACVTTPAETVATSGTRVASACAETDSSVPSAESGASWANAPPAKAANASVAANRTGLA